VIADAPLSFFCAGLAAAWSLSRFPEKYEVELWESLPNVGGVASTCSVGAGNEQLEINDQVQGGAPSYRNNLLLLEQVGVETHPVDFKVAFGVGENAWSNHGEKSDLVNRLQTEIARFGRVLQWIYKLEFIFAFVPIDSVLKWWGFSDDFRTRMCYPLTALFFGTANKQTEVSAAVVARVFIDPQLRLFEYSPDRLLDEVPRMFSYPKLHDCYEKLVAAMPSVRVRTSTPVDAIERNAAKGELPVRLYSSAVEGRYKEFDDIILCCGAEQALKMLGGNATWLERRLLSNVKYYNDLIVTHEDEEYMKNHYTFHPTDDMYFIRTDGKKPRIIEMSFNLSAYQPHLKQAGRAIYQTIFLDENLSEHWTVAEIDPSKILKQRTTRQFSHSWRHFASWVPFVRFLQGNNNTWYAGAYTLFNTHEIAVMSGLAAADRLGCTYPFSADPLAAMQYNTYFKMAHGFFSRQTSAADNATDSAAAVKKDV
jgi:predicted NAD/FAD-binding protein